MGGSLAGALRGKCRTVIGIAPREETIETAAGRGLIDRGTTDLTGGIDGADVVVLATPVRVIMQQLSEIGSLLSEGSLLMDLGSTKKDIVEKMARLPHHVQPLGGHPMCGQERSGIEEADPGLYQGCTFILSPLPRTSKAALELGQALVEAIGAHPLVLKPGRQDYLVGTISHLPYLLACALVASADATTSTDPAVWEIVAGGFRDTTRVASSDVTMMLDILLTNRDEVLKALHVYLAKLRDLTRLVEAGDEEEMRVVLSSVQEKRRAMFP
jgi:prephenate dehydrogenase